MLRLRWIPAGVPVRPDVVRHTWARGAGLHVPPGAQVRPLFAVGIPFVGGHLQIVRLLRRGRPSPP